MKISALIIARNEEKKIKRCLESIFFVDEIVVVLDRSFDRTKKITKAFTDKIFQGSWEFEGDRRNFGIRKCSYNWILEIDADEIVNSKLRDEIKSKVKNSKYDFYYINILNFVENTAIRNGWMSCLAPDGKFCLFKKKCKTWENQRVHPNYKIEGIKGPQFQNSLDHYMSNDVSELVTRFNRNTDLRAQDLFDQKEILSKYFSIRKVISRFLKCFIKRKGYKEGLLGLLISILSSLYLFVSAVKAEHLEKETMQK